LFLDADVPIIIQMYFLVERLLSSALEHISLETVYLIWKLMFFFFFFFFKFKKVHHFLIKFHFTFFSHIYIICAMLIFSVT